MRNPFAAHDPSPKRRPSFTLFTSFAVEIALNNAKLSRILTPYLFANQPFHVNRKFRPEGAQKYRPNTHEGDT
jgi:hypothetical protein